MCRGRERQNKGGSATVFQRPDSRYYCRYHSASGVAPKNVSLGMTVNRRSFIRLGAACAAGGMLLPGSAWGAATTVGANDRINVALIGCRNMGWHDLMDFLRHKEVRCLALCDIDEGILTSRATELAKMQDFKPDIYRDYRQVLDRKDVAVVIIVTPDHWHSLQFVHEIRRASSREK